MAEEGKKGFLGKIGTSDAYAGFTRVLISVLASALTVIGFLVWDDFSTEREDNKQARLAVIALATRVTTLEDQQKAAGNNFDSFHQWVQKRVEDLVAVVNGANAANAATNQELQKTDACLRYIQAKIKCPP